MTKEEIRLELLNDDTLYCCYCGVEKHSFSCCEEVHYETFSEMHPHDQATVINERLLND
jgi:hypothetical protein